MHSLSQWPNRLGDSASFVLGHSPIQIVTNFQPVRWAGTASGGRGRWQAISNGQLYGQTGGAHLSFIVRVRSPSLARFLSELVAYT